MVGESWFASIALLAASVLWAGLAAVRNRQLLRTKGEVVAVRPVKGRRSSTLFLPTVRFSSEGEDHEVEIFEPLSLRIGDEVVVLHPPGRPDGAAFSGHSFRGPFILLVISLLFAVAALSR